MKNILVTGGAGYIGSHACKLLADEGYQPVTFDNLVHGHRWAVQWGPFFEGDINDRADLDHALEKFRPAAVMHFAAFASVGESVTDPGKYYRNNVAGSLNLVEAMRSHGVDKLVFSSTCAIYGVPEVIPIPETHAQQPVSPYGATKLIIERLLADFDHAHRLRSVSLRYFNAAGADRLARIGEAHDPETHLIPLALDAAAGMRAEVTVFGDQYPTGDGTCVRDYIHVDDLAQAHLLALRHLENGGSSTAYNLGNGRGFSVREVIASVERVTGKAVPVRMGGPRAGDPPSLVGDASRVRNELGWSPAYPELDAIVETAWAWRQRAAHQK